MKGAGINPRFCGEHMKTRSLQIVMCLAGLTMMAPAAFAEEYVHPESKPAFSVPIPSSWEAEENDSGFTANPKDGGTAEVAYFVVEGDEALDEATNAMGDYVDESWTNVKTIDEETVTENGVKYRMIVMQGVLKADKSETDAIQVWIYPPAPGYAAFAVMSVGVDDKNQDKYIEQFADMLTGTKAVSSKGGKGRAPAAEEEEESEEE